jgi:murein DD-endopeptidase MepM/ murein hydrolase activator NlpD
LPLALVLLGAGTLWRHRAPRPQSISYEPPEVRPEAKRAPEPIRFGPAWPPTDEDWRFAFARVSWTHPLPGPVRRLPVVDPRILFGGEPSKNHPPPSCREPGRCGVDLGGELWGEHVYAVYEGVVDRVQRGGSDEGPGQYVRLSHFGGMVFTQYAHLAAVPRGLARGTRIKAGEVIGLVGDTGDTGLRGRGRHLHFALSIRPSPAFPEVYWDPSPWMARWSLRLPPHGTVAGFSSATGAVAAAAKLKLN